MLCCVCASYKLKVVQIVACKGKHIVWRMNVNQNVIQCVTKPSQDCSFNQSMIGT